MLRTRYLYGIRSSTDNHKVAIELAIRGYNRARTMKRDVIAHGRSRTIDVGRERRPLCRHFLAKAQGRRHSRLAK